ncbi:MAG: glutamine-hydrolyzing carbamoyl-phosphate synthase small subunit [Verrucomicrobiota bacterium]
MTRHAVLALEDGTILRGRAFGASVTVCGEAVFNTSMSGYQEILTDPSYYGQIVTMTVPQIGNYGVNEEDLESSKPHAAGFVVRELSPVVSNWRATSDLGSWLAKHGIPGIEGVDTRALTKKLRVAGVMKSCLSTEGISDDEALRRARSWSGTVGADFVKEVTCKAPYHFNAKAGSCESFTVPGTALYKAKDRPVRYRIAAYDFGAKTSIFRRLVASGFDVHVFPATTPAAEIRKFNPDGVFLSNGPGDPAALKYAHEAVADLIKSYPVFGICLGHQIITHAIGASTYKLKFGHRGGNQPVKNVEEGRVAITAQNHGFASKAEELERCGAVVTEVNLNDGTVSGLRLKDRPVFSVQYHPEAGPGPNDADVLFDRFYEQVAKVKGAR